MKFSVSSNKLLYYCLQLNKNIIEEVLGVLYALPHRPFGTKKLKAAVYLVGPRKILKAGKSLL